MDANILPYFSQPQITYYGGKKPYSHFVRLENFKRHDIFTKISEIYPLIAWLISTQYKIPVTAGPINPKLPALVSARFKMQNKPYFLFRIFECFVLINKSFDWLINIISYDQKPFDLNQGQKKIKTIFLKLKKERWRRFKLLSEADLESLSSKSESTTTKRSTSTWLNVYHAWAKVRNKNPTLKVILLLTNWTRFCAKISSYSVLQILIHTINSESHGFFGQFWENRPSRFYFEVFQIALTTFGRF